jgi:hypothetical protein
MIPAMLIILAGFWTTAPNRCNCHHSGLYPTSEHLHETIFLMLDYLSVFTSIIDGCGPVNRESLCKIWSFGGGDCEECRPLGYENPVRTSQETHYVSATEPSQLMLCKIWRFHGSDYEECRLLGYKNPVRTSQETHYVSATEPNRLTLYKIWGFGGGNYEECRLLGYEKPVHTSQETHYVSTTDANQVMLCKIWSFHRAMTNVISWDINP